MAITIEFTRDVFPFVGGKFFVTFISSTNNFCKRPDQRLSCSLGLTKLCRDDQAR